MINNINFIAVVDNMLNIFSESNIEIDSLEKEITILADSNFKCYHANMEVIQQRKESSGPEQYRVISDNELIARTVGEKRVAAKAKINKILSDSFGNNYIEPSNWIEDDIVYSVGEMIDRILIEHIKQEDFKQNEEQEKLSASLQWQNRVLEYLKQKITSAKSRNAYECIEEMRTYRI